jgi:K+-sensing histidine kinase KdpD
MRIDKLIVRDYPTVGYYSGVNTVRDKLFEKDYLIAVDDENNYKGVLTPRDLVSRPHKIVADCLTAKDALSVDDTLHSSIDLFEKNQTTVLPVFNRNEFVGVLEKHGVLTELQREVLSANNKPDSSEKVKYNFLENLSHEIRTPLNGIIGFIELLKENKDSLVDREAAGRIIMECTDRFLMTMQNLSELALMQSGIKECIMLRDVYVSTVFCNIDKYFNTIASHNRDNIKIVFEENYYDVCITTDKEVLTEILFHFIANSVSVFHNRTIYLGYFHEDDNDHVVFFVSNNNHNKGGICCSGWNEEEDEAFRCMNSDGLGVAMTLLKEYGVLINAEIKVLHDNYNNAFYCRVPLNVKEKQLSHISDEIAKNQN